jgi:hypothetical protein
MTLVEFKSNVQAIFPIRWEDTFMNDEDPTNIDKILQIALKKAFSRFEKIESNAITGSQIVDRAGSIITCVPSLETDRENLYGVFNLMFTQNVGILNFRVGEVMSGGLPKIKHYFDPGTKMLKLLPQGVSVYLEYTVDPKKLVIEDLDLLYIEWALNYANALLKIKEGFIGKGALPTVMPFEFNYDDMRTSGESEKEKLETDLEDMYQGTFAIRIS